MDSKLPMEGVWRHFDVDALPREGTLIRLARGAGMFTGLEAEFLTLVPSIADSRGVLEGPWVIGIRRDISGRPLICLARAWDWLDSSSSSSTSENK